jgi:hypothetical protein
MAADHEELRSRDLLVEGPDDQNVFFHLASRHGLAEQFTVSACDGIEAALESLEARLLAENEERLGIVIELDGGDLADAIQRL